RGDEVLLDLLLQPRRELDARVLEEAHLDQLRVRRGDAYVDACVEPLRLHEVAGDRSGDDAQVGDRDAGRDQPGDDRALHEPAGRWALARGDDARVALQRRPERSTHADGDLGRQVDVHESLDAVGAEEGRPRARLPDQVLVDLRARLGLLVRVDAHARHDDALRADRHLVADRDALVNADVRADVARTPDHRALDQRGGADVGRRIDDRPGRPRTLAQRHARAEHALRTDLGIGGDARGRVMDCRDLGQL